MEQEASSSAAALGAWLRSAHSVDLDAAGLELRSSGLQGLGVFAKRRLPPGSSLGSIPAAAVLHAGKACASDFGQRVMAALNVTADSARGTLEPAEMLWLYMIWGLQEPDACPWFPYLQSIAAEDPLVWRRDVLARRLLRGTPLGRDAASAVWTQRRRHEQLLGRLCVADPALFSMERFSLQRWFWAQDCYVSRAFDCTAFPSGYRPTSGYESDILCPLLDALNHSGDVEVAYNFSETAVGLSLPHHALKAYAPGDEVFMKYGAMLGNDKLLARYGFVLKSNQHDALREVVFQSGPSVASSRLKLLVGIEDLCLEAEQGPQGAVSVRIESGLRAGLEETPLELLRAAALLVHGKDYAGEAASCGEKQEAASALATALRCMLRKSASLRIGLLLRDRKRKRRLDNGVVRSKGKRTFRSVGERNAATYASGWRRLVRAAAERAEMEAELAELAGKMGQSDDDSGDAGSGASS